MQTMTVTSPSREKKWSVLCGACAQARQSSIPSNWTSDKAASGVDPCEALADRCGNCANELDKPLERDREQAEALLDGCGYLRDGAVTIEGVAFYGSPWQPAFLGWAFNLDRGEALAAKWRAIPDDTDVLITHGPPAGIGDLCSNGDHAGCSDLLARVREVKPRYHLFGHIHEGYGVYPEGETTFVNASICTASYQPTQAPIVVDL